MTIDVPDKWARRFASYDTALKMLVVSYASETGCSRKNICDMFAACAGQGSCWKDESFRVWAALRGWCDSVDIQEYLRDEEEKNVASAEPA